MADRQDTELNGGAESNESATVGNRPATGARLVDTPASLPSGFGGGQEATDFLGLSQELGGMDGGAPAGTEAPSPRIGGWVPVEPDPSQTWLLSGEAAPEEGATELEESDEEALAAESTDTGRSRRYLSFAAALLVIGAAVTVAMKFSSRSKLATTPPIATRPTPRPIEPTKTPVADPSGSETPPPVETVSATVPPVEAEAPPDPTVAPVATTMPGAEASEDLPDAAADPAPAARPAAGRISEWMSANGWSRSAPVGEDEVEGTAFSSSPSGWSTAAPLAFATRSPLALPGADSPEVPAGESLIDGDSLPTANVTFRNGEGGVRAPVRTNGHDTQTTFVGAFRVASADEMSGIWNASTVPPDALDSESRILTPVVGDVRVLLKTGEIFDGKLYAVGGGSVWLETAIGRLSLNARHVLRIDQVFVDKDAKIVDALPRMRVRTPGGLFFGKVLSRGEGRVTLLLEGGGRITLESTDVEAAPLGDTRIVGQTKPE